MHLSFTKKLFLCLVVGSLLTFISPLSSSAEEYQWSPSIDEPTIRVGFHKTDKKVQFVSPFPYSLNSGGADLGVLPESELATITYADGVYSFVSDSLTVTSSDYLRLMPGDIENFFSIQNLDRHLVTRGKLNYNTFRGGLEYRFAPKSGVPYLINELLLENYVKLMQIVELVVLVHLVLIWEINVLGIKE